MAKTKGCMLSQLVLAWLLAQDEHIVLIPGAKRRTYLEENIGAIEITLTNQKLKEIEEIAHKGVAAGERYPEAQMDQLNR